jgi:hypothetical protein
MVEPLGASAWLVAAALGIGPGALAAEPRLDLAGVWTMVSAYEIRADGSRTTAYGEHPLGLMMVDGEGRYSIQIFRPDRPTFASGEKTRGAPDEYRLAVVGSSTHFGRVRSDPAAHKLVFEVEAASYPNWQGKTQVRDYAFDGDTLTYRVPASASGDGTIAYSVWRKIGP